MMSVSNEPGGRMMTGVLLWCVLTLCTVVFAPSSADASDVIRAPVNDYAGVIPDPVEAHVGEKLRDHFDETGVQMAVLLVESTGEMPIEEYSLKVAQQWGGGRAGEDRGVLLTLAIADRRSRLEIGYGLEAIIPDPMAARILADMRPMLRQKRYDRAVRDAVNAVIARTESLEPGQRPGFFAANPLWRMTYGFWGVILLGLLLGAAMAVLHERNIGPFGPQPILAVGGVLLAVGLLVGLAAFGIAAPGYLLVYAVGVVMGVGIVTQESFLRLAPVVALLIVGGAWYAIPELFARLGSNLNNSLVTSGMLALLITILPFGGIRFGGRTYGGFGSSSGSFGSGGYSGGGGGFGGGGASGGW